MFNLVIAVPLACSVLLAVLWVRSYFATDEIQRELVEVTGGRHSIWRSMHRLGSKEGRVYLAREVMTADSSWDSELGRTVWWRYAGRDTFPDYPLELALECEGIELDIPRPPARLLGFGGRRLETMYSLIDYVVVPYWALLAGVVIPPAAVVLRRARAFQPIGA